MSDEEPMFKFHGYSGPCPKPPLPKPEKHSIDLIVVHSNGDDWAIDITVDGAPYQALGPFATEDACKRAVNDLLEMIRSVRPT